MHPLLANSSHVKMQHIAALRDPLLNLGGAPSYPRGHPPRGQGKVAFCGISAKETSGDLLFFGTQPAADSLLPKDESTLRDLSLLEDTPSFSGEVRAPSCAALEAWALQGGGQRLSDILGLTSFGFRAELSSPNCDWVGQRLVFRGPQDVSNCGC